MSAALSINSPALRIVTETRAGCGLSCAGVEGDGESLPHTPYTVSVALCFGAAGQRLHSTWGRTDEQTPPDTQYSLYICK